MKVVGLTGGIASGKSTVTKYLRSRGVPVFDADASATEAVAVGSRCLEEIREQFGPAVLNADGSLNRRAMAAIVFADRKELARLEKIIHGHILEDMRNFIATHGKERLVVLDAAILLEKGWQAMTDEVWLVVLDEERQVQRAMERSGMTADEVRARIRAQMPVEEKKKYAAVILDNNGTHEELEQQVERQLAALPDA